MKIVFALLVLTVISFGNAKMYEQCELIMELWYEHNVASEDLYKHLCAVNSNSMFNTDSKTSGKNVCYGIYSLCEPWWCNKTQKGGKCNLLCSNLINDDITDDVACAKIVMSSEGLQAWGTNVKSCSDQYQKKVELCLEENSQTTIASTELENESTSEATICRCPMKVVKKKDLIIQAVIFSLSIFVALIMYLVEEYLF